MRWISLQEAILFQKQVVAETGGSIGVLDEGKLKAALLRPLHVVFDYDPFPTPALKVAALIESIITTHPFLDGNKRTAMRIGLALLEYNFLPQHVASDADIEAFAVGIANHTITRSEVARWLEGLYRCSDSSDLDS
ncbi:type II toxin-antitoxin system death-on-curing family toxin [Sulfobacillus sp. hq2]|uniref:type II toxin-antitoxin system death-on-curing family toxin n=1 Tax=Sulfobacillus sp. hq2 TaxID=2039167 RepID=UPI000CD29354|nr:type II toxin-antitoxin system death-on-curing family toxin [Sulfobacillus sp. hq2]POB12161.1 death-on-curing protein [Sulfobacillus sp. hq2]